MRRANRGDPACLQQLREILDARPDIWRTVGDASRHAEQALILRLAKGNALAEDALPRRLKELKAGLAGSSASPLESLLVGLIGVRWLATHQAEIDAAETTRDLKLATFRLERAESTQRRLASTIKSLLLVRSHVPAPVPPKLPRIFNGGEKSG